MVNLQCDVLNKDVVSSHVARARNADGNGPRCNKPQSGKICMLCTVLYAGSGKNG